MRFARCWIQVDNIFYVFIIDYKLEINQEQLNDKVMWQ